MENAAPERLAALREEMAKAGVDAVLIPRTDPHRSEYLSDRWQTIRWLTGFTGSAATLVVTPHSAMLWTDSRYFLQAAEQLRGSTVELMRDGLPDTPSYTQVLISELPEGATVGVDGMLLSVNDARSLRDKLAAKGLRLVTDFDPLPAIWPDRPGMPADKIFVHDVKYAGESAADKLARITGDIFDAGADSMLVSDLSDIAWTLNLRCNDVNMSPVTLSYLLIRPQGGSTLFVETAKVTPEVEAALRDCGVAVMTYDSLMTALSSLPAGERVLLPTDSSSVAVEAVLGDRAVMVTSPIAILKACKNEVQIEGFRRAMERDGVAMVKAWMEIERTLAEGGKLTEMSVADIFLKYRSEQPLFYDLSFESIVGYGPHGSIVHYTATPDTDVRIYPDGLLLVDSGANYLDGTTDITRTVSLGNPTPEQRFDFTLVIQGMIALARAVYPEGTRGAQLDVLARFPMWRHGLSYLHGTGHGVGHFLNVHEGPQSIRLQENPVTLRPGMITSDEPGIYREGRWGIRSENLLLTVEAMDGYYGQKFLRFETLTLFPFDRSLFDLSMMTDEEIRWVDDYHAMVHERLSPMLNDEERRWLAAKTAPLA